MIDKLSESGFPIDWPVMAVGWRQGYLTREQLLSFAMDQIGTVPPNQAGTVTELAFTDPTDVWTVERHVSELVPNAPPDQGNAARIWRWVLLNDKINALSIRVERTQPAEPNFKDIIDMCSDVCVELWEFWADHQALGDEPPRLFGSSPRPKSATVEQGQLAYVKDVLDNHRVWLAKEKLEIMG